MLVERQSSVGGARGAQWTVFSCLRRLCDEYHVILPATCYVHIRMIHAVHVMRLRFTLYMSGTYRILN
jgi:hypothetical protein